MLKKLSNLKNHKSFRIFIYALVVLQILYLVLIISISIILIDSEDFRFSHDFLAYYTGAEIIKDNPQNLYVESEQLNTQIELQEIKPKTFLHFVNPPFVAYSFIPLTAFSVLTSYYLWLAINLIILVFILITVFKYFKDYDWWIRILLIFLILTIQPTLITLGLGQLSFVIFLAILGSWYFYNKNKDFVSGMIMSLLLIKPQYMPLTFLVLAFSRNLKTFFGLLTGILGLIFISFFSSGLSGIISYVSFLNEYANRGQEFARQLTAMANIQLISFAIFGANTINAIYFYTFVSSILALIVLFVWFLKIKKSTYSSNIRWAVLVLTILLISPHTNPQDYFLIVLVFIFLLPKNVNNFIKLNKKMKFIILSLFPAILFLFNIPFPKIFFAFYLLFVLGILIYEIIKAEGVLKRSNHNDK